MADFFKSRAGWLLAGIHLLLVTTCLLYVSLIDGGNVIVVFILMVLTAPWWILLAWIVFESGIVTGEALHSESLFTFYAVFGAIINACILYLLGVALTKAFNYVSSKK
ncbi:MAG TPA: hypothetical protein PLD38_10275 [Pyrinomonadaceae bacterium]|nr:hypothetical protein [Chloracidobacterium sp.]MBP9935992.1 hypothetical protein [Pyrinomonadaceae bacterium]MBK9768271.1 hypothetical protein [Chloracidobacterium sp.]MBL0239281.1 hypothetical protein [Chloracidobacterium sp.]HQY67655.1 hypothetical protein [Pyrinomonadaceae bacterium]